MTPARMLHLDGDSSDRGLERLREAVDQALASLRAGSHSRVSARRIDVRQGGIALFIEGEPGRTIPKDADGVAMLVDALSRPLATRADLDAADQAMAAVAAFVETDLPHVMLRTAVPWQTAYACGCICPLRNMHLPHDAVRRSRVEVPLPPELALAMGDVVVAVMDGGALRLRPLSWGGSHDPYVSTGHHDGDWSAPAIADPMTAMRTVRDIVAARAASTTDGTTAATTRPGDDVR